MGSGCKSCGKERLTTNFRLKTCGVGREALSEASVAVCAVRVMEPRNGLIRCAETFRWLKATSLNRYGEEKEDIPGSKSFGMY
ncbi:MAG: hypothetical protein OXC63_02505 [Aestuariivita sp.]|nr:hypothetical protein [Aestuariivita sp.]